MEQYRTVLIVDDSPTSRMIIQRCVEMSGLSVGAFKFAENGIDALEAVCSDETIDLVFSDINMPKMDGETFVRELRARKDGSRVEVVITSSVADGPSAEGMRALGVTRVIKKPVSPEKVLHALEER
ncbi:MAG TPA: response regulator [Treponemataceae bacterium]|jgi:two-component system chemotaxis response regulator CheY|nr:response regulator [Treponemataceae bacterium]